MKFDGSKGTLFRLPRVGSQGLLFDVASLVEAVLLASIVCSPAIAADKPNIVVIFGDDIGQDNVSAYHRGLREGRVFALRRGGGAPISGRACPEIGAASPTD